jgi:hypothetical protein
MFFFRWLILRLFGSLLLLLLLAFPLFWLLHEVVYPGVELADEFIALGLWILLFAVTSLLLSRAGAKRFALLEEAGREAIANSQNESAEEALHYIQSLFASGLVSGNFQQKVKRRLLRQYFSFFANHLEKAQHREQIREAWREGVRAEEGYEILKNYVLQQPALTLPTIDLAEELLERQPDDGDLLSYLTQKYLQERQTHFRAEHIFRQYLARNGPLVPEIIALCLARLLSRQAGPRVDDFAAWCYVRAFQHGEENNATLRQLLHETQLRFQRVGRHDALAKAVTTIAADFSAEEIAGWAVARQERQARSWRFQAERILFKLQQQLLELYSRWREQRKWLYRLAGAIVVLGVGYFVLSGKPAKVQNKTVSPAPEDSTVVYYALQVGAIRNANTAQREAERFRKRGLEVYVFKPGPSQRWHRIRVGKYRSKQAAQMAADSLKTAGIVRDCFITEYEKR